MKSTTPAAEPYLAQLLKFVDKINRDSSRKQQPLRDACKNAIGKCFFVMCWSLNAAIETIARQHHLSMISS
jgi:hypothetical protein